MTSAGARAADRAASRGQAAPQPAGRHQESTHLISYGFSGSRTSLTISMSPTWPAGVHGQRLVACSGVSCVATGQGSLCCADLESCCCSGQHAPTLLACIVSDAHNDGGELAQEFHAVLHVTALIIVALREVQRLRAGKARQAGGGGGVRSRWPLQAATLSSSSDSGWGEEQRQQQPPRRTPSLAAGPQIGRTRWDGVHAGRTTPASGCPHGAAAGRARS